MIDERPLEEIAAEHGLSLIHPPDGTSMLKRIISSLDFHLRVRNKMKKIRKGKRMLDNIGIEFLVWDNGSLRSCVVRRERDKKGRFVPFNSTISYPGLLVDTKEKGEIRQDEQAKLYFVRV